MDANKLKIVGFLQNGVSKLAQVATLQLLCLQVTNEAITRAAGGLVARPWHSIHVSLGTNKTTIRYNAGHRYLLDESDKIYFDYRFCVERFIEKCLGFEM